MRQSAEFTRRLSGRRMGGVANCQPMTALTTLEKQRDLSAREQFPFIITCRPYLSTIVSPGIRVTQGLSGQNLVPDSLFLSRRDRELGCSQMRGREPSTRTLSSGKPPSTFRSHIRAGLESTKIQTRNLPAVSSVVNGTIEIEASSGGGKVRKSSVATHCTL